MGSFEAQVDSFIQVTVFCPPDPRVGAFFTGMRERSVK